VLAVDTNVLIYAHRREAIEHTIAVRELTRLAQGSERWAIPWPCIYEFFSVVTNPRIWKDAASTAQQASAQVGAWCGSPSLVLIGESEGFWTVLEPLLARPRVRGAVAHDAHVAAICLAHGVEALLTRDRDFALFPELRTRNPFA
jgi:uncharacterized protein